MALLDGGLKKTIGAAMKSIFLPATLTRTVLETPENGKPYDVEAAEEGEPQTYPCKAIPEEFSERFKLEGTVGEGKSKVLILAVSLATEPKAGDRITVKGKTATVTEKNIDPAGAVWTCFIQA